MLKTLTKQLNIKLALRRDKDHPIQGNRSLAESFGFDAQLLDDPLFFTPMDSDYVLVPTRMLSACLVQSNMFNFGFNNGQALMAACAAGMFNGLTIFKNHDTQVENWLGKTQDTFWEDTTAQNVPPGVTGFMNLDKKSDPKVIRGILSGALDSVSVTVQFTYEKSHPDMEESEFWWSLGEKDDKGNPICLNIIEILSVKELSVVWCGADPHAKNKPQQEGFSQNPPNSHQLFKEGHMDPIKLLAKKLGLDPEKADLVALQERLDVLQSFEAKTVELTQALAEATTKTAAAEATLAELNTQLEAMKTERDNLKPMAEVGTQHFQAQVNEAVRVYTVAMGDKVVPAMVETIKASQDLATAQGFLDSFKAQAEQVAPLTCTKCGCTELSRKASKDSQHQPTDQVASGALAAAEQRQLEAAVGALHRF